MKIYYHPASTTSRPLMLFAAEEGVNVEFELVDLFTGAHYKDEYTEGLRSIIDAKIAGEEIVAPEVEEPAKVVDLMEALRRSLDSVSGDKKKPAKAALAVARKAKGKGQKSNSVRKAAAG